MFVGVIALLIYNDARLITAIHEGGSRFTLFVMAYLVALLLIHTIIG
ncbi:MAG: hypothetical protein WKF89_02070 [Chitinophagaceae bacterium]